MDTFDFDTIMQDRRAAVEKSIRPINTSELKTLGNEIFPYLDDSWRDAFFGFLQENAGSTFYHAATHDRIHVIYCRDKDKGMWFMPGRGKGQMQARGLAILKEIVDQR
jgi:hypothetical protein